VLGKLRGLWAYLGPWRRRFGPVAGTRLGLQVRRLQYAARAGTTVQLRVPGLPHPVLGRARSSDAYVFRQHFLEEELAAGLPAAPGTIVDAGANAGYAALYLLRRFPAARIVCVEVDAGNLELLARNVAPYPQVEIVPGGLWSHATRLGIANPDGDAYAFVVAERADGPIAAWGVDDLMRERGLTRIDLLKLDIEGAEVEVLSSAERWIGDVETVLVEPHEDLRPGVAALIATVARSHGFAMSGTGEYTVLRRTPASSPHPIGPR
jgi:FkbM family methyltransferase